MLESDKVQMYLDVAKAHAKHSKANRKKVGACIVTQTGVILAGINGTPSGSCNQCECTETGFTLETVIHAELNAILKAAKEGVSVQNASLYVTLSPCLACAAMIKQAGIKNVYYIEKYRDEQGIKYLTDNQVNVYHCFDQSRLNLI
jgi:dCMP deaminase